MVKMVVCGTQLSITESNSVKETYIMLGNFS